jgi:hypothetical protein
LTLVILQLGFKFLAVGLQLADDMLMLLRDTFMYLRSPLLKLLMQSRYFFLGEA